MNITAVIPARFASVRFPGKALAIIDGKPMIQHVYERTLQASLVNTVIVATDDERIYQAVTAFGGDCRMTRQSHETGTDRLAEVAETLPADIIVNVQGDEPLIAPEMIDQAIRPFLEDSSLRMGTLKTRIRYLHDFLSPNVVKVVTDRVGNALYFSRSPLPFFRDKWQDLKDESFASGKLLCYKHVGLYVFRRDFLVEFAAMAPTFLEVSEKLEQLRALENGMRIDAALVDTVPLGVDTPADLERARTLLR
jgi:3-deoxy-manno-octulosonate cytidylyltransferase (CMP-KDO synthetase)